MLAALSGFKTYIIAGLMILSGLAEGLGGDGIAGFAGIDWMAIWGNLSIILEGLGLATLRAGVSKVLK